MTKPPGGARTPDETPVPEDDWERVGATLRWLRQTRGFTPAALANEVGITTPYLHNLEAGRKKLTNEKLAKFAEALAVSQIAIMRPIGGKPNDPPIPDIDYRDPNHRRTIHHEPAHPAA